METVLLQVMQMNYSFDEEVDQSGKSFCCAYFRDAEANLIDFYISFLDEDFEDDFDEDEDDEDDDYDEFSDDDDF